MDELIELSSRPDVSNEEISLLAIRLAQSGEQLTRVDRRLRTDVPSTGGPSSLSTLLCPLILVLGGAVVPKLGVPGRPAGGIDTLASIPGFNPHLTRAEVDRCLATCSYAHILAGEAFAPLDAKLFAYRRSVGAKDNPVLTIASLLCKKLAVAVERVTLDVRVGRHTNFGGTWDEARVNARQFIGVARILGISATCILTDATVPYQPFIGRGESLLALDRVFSGETSGELSNHLGLCAEMADLCLDTSTALSSEELGEVFRQHLQQQGASWSSFASKVREVESEPTATLRAGSDGYFSVDLDGIRRSIVTRQELAKSEGEAFPDPCGITFLIPCGTVVSEGDDLARVRSTSDLDSVLIELHRCMLQSESPLARRSSETLTESDS